MNKKQIEEDKTLWGGTKFILKEAIDQGIKIKKISPWLFELKYKGKTEYMHRIDNNLMGKVTLQIIGQKAITKYFLNKAKVEHPKGTSFNKKNIKGIKAYAKTMKYPIVLKPAWGARGENVYPNIKNPEELMKKIKQMKKIKWNEILLEEHFTGDEFRVFATIDGFFAVLNRIPANVVGNGKKTIKQLVKEKNVNRGGLDPDVKKIKLTKKVKEYLTEQKKSIEYIPKQGETIQLSKISNISQGGDSIDATEIAHPSLKKKAFKVLKAIPGLNYAGIDFIIKDITKPIKKGNYVVIEMNNEPGVVMHKNPWKGKSRNAAKALLKLMFPELDSQKF